MNSPFQFELFQVPNQANPYVPTARIHLLEHGWGETTILPGEERFVLRDGMTYLLKRTGHEDIRFTIPTRSAPSTETDDHDVNELDLPRTVS